MTNESIRAAFERFWQHVIAKLDNKANVDHTHEDTYNKNSIDTFFSNLINGTTTTGKASKDGSGNVITETYETKTEASNKLAEAKTYADNAAATVKNDLLNGAGAAYDTLQELGALIDENADAIAAIEAVGGNKADANHTHSYNDLEDRPFYTKDPVEVSLLAENSITIGDDLYTEIPLSENLVEGDTYVVTFNGTRYECVAWYSTGLRAVLIGNGSMAGEEGRGNGEPFYCDFYQNGGCFLNTSTTGTHTISISHVFSEVVQLERKYIADYIDNLPGEKVDGKVYTIESESGSETITAGEGAEVFNDYTNNIASGRWAHAEGTYTQATGMISHAEGYNAKATGGYSHAEGSDTTASGQYSHAEGAYTNATGDHSHAEGHGSTASGYYSHAQGGSTTASGQGSHAEGNGSVASGKASHAEGQGTTASSTNQHVQGRFNIEDAEEVYAHIVGNGKSDTTRSNAHTVDWDGNGWFAGDIYVGGTGKDDTENAKKLATIDEVNALEEHLNNAFIIIKGEETTLTVGTDIHVGQVINFKYPSNEGYNIEYVSSDGMIGTSNKIAVSGPAYMVEETLTVGDKVSYTFTNVYAIISRSSGGVSGAGSSLPEVTTEDNNKILMVVDGAWTPTPVAMGAETLF